MPTHPAIDPVAHLAWLLRDQARACEAMGSPLYAYLLERAAEDAEARGVCWRVLREHVRPGRSDALALRFMASVHRLVLTGRAPRLAAHYPSAARTHPSADRGTADVWPVFREAVVEHAGELAGLVALPCQTNEVGRAAALVVGFLELAAHGLPLRCLEIGASAGLNLRWDHFRYGDAGLAWGDRDSPVDLTGLWGAPPPVTPGLLEVPVRVVERRGCDVRPVDATTPGGRLALTASVWADQRARLARLRGAFRLAARVPAPVDAAPADVWLADRLAAHAGEVTTVVFQSVVDEYLADAAQGRVTAAITGAGRRAGAGAPVAWLRLEPIDALRRHGLVLTVWPGGDERLLAVCGAHGSDVRRPDGA